MKRKETSYDRFLIRSLLISFTSHFSTTKIQKCDKKFQTRKVAQWKISFSHFRICSYLMEVIAIDRILMNLPLIFFFQEHTHYLYTHITSYTHGCRLNTFLLYVFLCLQLINLLKQHILELKLILQCSTVWLYASGWSFRMCSGFAISTKLSWTCARIYLWKSQNACQGNFHKYWKTPTTFFTTMYILSTMQEKACFPITSPTLYMIENFVW